MIIVLQKVMLQSFKTQSLQKWYPKILNNFFSFSLSVFKSSVDYKGWYLEKQTEDPGQTASPEAD